jgi:ankyrin repeat protein
LLPFIAQSWELALLIASDNGHAEMVQGLLAKGANVESKDEVSPSLGNDASVLAHL